MKKKQSEKLNGKLKLSKISIARLATKDLTKLKGGATDITDYSCDAQCTGRSYPRCPAK
jgi:natural product precursor